MRPRVLGLVGLGFIDWDLLLRCYGLLRLMLYCFGAVTFGTADLHT